MDNLAHQVLETLQTNGPCTLQEIISHINALPVYAGRDMAGHVKTSIRLLLLDNLIYKEGEKYYLKIDLLKRAFNIYQKRRDDNDKAERRSKKRKCCPDPDCQICRNYIR